MSKIPALWRPKKKKEKRKLSLRLAWFTQKDHDEKKSQEGISSILEKILVTVKSDQKIYCILSYMLICLNSSTI